MHEQPVDDLERALLDVLVRAVDRVAGLEPDDRLPAALARTRRASRPASGGTPGSRRARAATAPRGRRRGSSRPSRRRPSRPGARPRRCGRRSTASFCLSRVKDAAHAEHGDRVGALGGRERHGATAAELVRLLLGRRRARPGWPTRGRSQVHRVEHRVVVGLALEAGQRAQRADGEHLEVAQLALVRHELRKVGGLGGERRGGVAGRRADRRGCRRAARWGTCLDIVCWLLTGSVDVIERCARAASAPGAAAGRAQHTRYAPRDPRVGPCSHANPAARRRARRPQPRLRSTRIRARS